MEIKELTDKIQEATAALRETADMYHKEIEKSGTARSETKDRLDRINADLNAQKTLLDEVGLKIERQKLILPGDKDPETKAQMDAFFKWVRGGKQSLEPSERKALVEDATGLVLVPEDLETAISRALPALTPMRGICGQRSTIRDKVRRRSLTEVSVGWGKLETGTPITETSLVPSDAYIYVEDLYGISKLGEDEMADTDVNLASYLAQSFTNAIAQAENTAFVAGTGHTYKQPEGIAVDATLKTTRYVTDLATADTIIPDDLLKCEYALPPQYLNGASWLFHRKAELAVRLVKAATTGNYLWQPSLMAGQPNNFDGFPIYNSADMNYPADTIDEATVAIFGNFRLGYLIVDRQGMTLQRLDELYAEAGLVGFKVHFRVGGGLVRYDTFQTLNNEST